MGKNNKRNFTGETFGRLTIIGEAPKRSNSPNSMWAALCDCGTETEVFSHNLTSGKTTSCGCFKQQRLQETADKRIAAVREYWMKYRAQKAGEEKN